MCESEATEFPILICVMKIVCLISPRPHAYAFVTSVHALFPVSLVIVERSEQKKVPFIQRLRQRIRNEGLIGLVVHHLRFMAGNKHSKRSMITDALNQYFGHTWNSLPPEIPVFFSSDINDQATVEKLRSEKPDIILDHGTSIVKKDIISSAPYTMNLHWGLSPYYRGSYCTKDALLQRDPLNIGVTIHALAPEVDGGGIIGQEYAHVTSGDTAQTIDVQLTALGTNIVKQALGMMKEGKTPTLHAQDLHIGRVSKKKEWGEEQEIALKNVYTAGLEEMLLHPARERQPIIQLR